MVRKMMLGWLAALLMAAVLTACSGDAGKVESSGSSSGSETTLPYPTATACNLGSGEDAFDFNGMTYTQNGNCTTDVVAFRDASQNARVVGVSNNLLGLGSGSSLVFQLLWQATGDTGAFLSPPDFLFLQEDGDTNFCIFLTGTVAITRVEDVGGLIEGAYAFWGQISPFFCNMSSIEGTFSAHIEADVVTGEGTQADPVLLTAGDAPHKGNVGNSGISNYAFVATAVTHTVAVTKVHSDLLWQAYSHKPNLGDAELLTCDNAEKPASESCALTGLTVGHTYYVQVHEMGGKAGSFQIAVN
ncbi:MAG TPA: hypothetical protein VF678_02640 [bacterium]